jgi:CHAT domain-containing protein
VALDTGDTDAAWRAIVRSRSLTPGADLPGGPRPLSVDLPPGRIILHYATTRTALLIWAIGPGGPRFAQSAVAPDELRRLVLAYQGTHQPAIGARLSEFLIQPVASVLTHGAELRIVPDGPLHQLPFGALPGRNQKYLVEEHPIAVWPDVSAALRVEAPATAGGSPTMTAIGNPLPAGRQQFADLPDAEREAREVAGLYESATLLLGPAATAEGVFAAIRTRAVVHIASHAIADRLAPDRSRLLLAGEATLTAGELRGGRFGAELVVLASCDSAAGRLTRSGPMGLAQALLSAGVPRIVAGYWAVDDRASAALFREFHVAYRISRDAAAALRTAQVTLIRSGDPELSHPRRWAALGLYAR